MARVAGQLFSLWLALYVSGVSSQSANVSSATATQQSTTVVPSPTPTLISFGAFTVVKHIMPAAEERRSTVLGEGDLQRLDSTNQLDESAELGVMETGLQFMFMCIT